MGTIRRVRRAVGNIPPSIVKNSIASGTAATGQTQFVQGGDDDRNNAANDGWDWDDHESSSSAVTANSKHAKMLSLQDDGGKGDPVNHKDSASERTMSLSEKLRQHEMLERQQQQPPQPQQAQRGPLMDSDHLQEKSVGGAEGSINSGWSWASSSRGTRTSATAGSVRNDHSLRGRPLARTGPSDTAYPSKRSRFSLPGVFKNIRRSMSMARHAFNERDHRVSGKPHGGDEVEDLGRRALFFRLLVWIGPLAALITLGGVFLLGRRRGHRLGETEQQRLASFAAAPSSLRSASPPSANEPSLRDDRHRGGRPDAPSDAIVVHHAVFPPYLSSLANLTTPYDSGKETPYFWDVPLSGESVAEAVFSQCYRLVQACEFGLRQPDYNEDVSGACVAAIFAWHRRESTRLTR